MLQDSPSGFLSPSPVLRLSPCLHRSLEGLNQELEEAFVKEQGDEELLRVSEAHKIALRLLGGLGSPSEDTAHICFLAMGMVSV